MAYLTNDKIMVESPVPIINVEKFELVQKYNEHGTFLLVAYLKEYKGNDIEAIWKLTEESNVTIKIKGKDENITFFSGIPINVKIYIYRSLHKIELTLSSYSILLDLEKKNRSFQNKDNLYSNIFKNIVNETEGNVIYTLSKELTQNQFILQYKETDWEFLKRIASHQDGMLLPDILSEKPNIFVGIPHLNKYKEIRVNYTVNKSMEDYYITNENFGESSELNFIEYTINSEYSYEVGSKILYQDVEFEIVEKISIYEKGILKFTYRIKKRDGIKQNKLYNEKVIGLTLEGRVIDRKEDKLKIHLDIDERQDVATAYWFKLATNYTTTGNTGFYSVPQIGDIVKLNIPTTSEINAFVKGGKRTDGETNPKTQDVKTKYFRNNYGNELMMSPSNVTYTAVDGETFVDLSKDEGIIATTKDDISISGKDISVSAGGNVFLGSKEQLSFRKGDLNIIMREKMWLNG